MSCAFCAIAAGDAPALVLHDDGRTLAFLDIRPWARGHTLVIPRRHAENLFDVDAAELAQLMETIRQLAPRLRDAVGADGVAVAQLNGAAAGQTVFHLHVHLLPRRAGEGLPTGPEQADYDLAELHTEISARL